MQCLIPVHNNRLPLAKVKDSIKAQGFPYQIVDCTIDTYSTKYDQIAQAKEKLRAAAIFLNEDFVVFNDSDIINLCEDNFQVGLDFLKKNVHFGAVAFSRNDLDSKQLIHNSNNPHICNGVMIVRKKALEVLRFNLMPKTFTCYSTGLSLIKNGYFYGYVDCKKRIEHISFDISSFLRINRMEPKL